MDILEIKDEDVLEKKVTLFVENGTIKSKVTFVNSREFVTTNVSNEGISQIVDKKCKTLVKKEETEMENNLELLQTAVVKKDSDSKVDSENFVDLTSGEDEKIKEESIEIVDDIKDENLLYADKVQSFEAVFLPEMYEDVVTDSAAFNCRPNKRQYSYLSEEKINVSPHIYATHHIPSQIINQPGHINLEVIELNTLSNDAFKNLPSMEKNALQSLEFTRTYCDISGRRNYALGKVFPNKPHASGVLSSSLQTCANKKVKEVPKTEVKKYRYKCPICKRCKVFDSLVAVNNHLKFEHLSVIKYGNKLKNTKMKR